MRWNEEAETKEEKRQERLELIWRNRLDVHENSLRHVSSFFSEAMIKALKERNDG